MMKKLLYIFMCLAMTQACIKENFPTSPNDVTEGEEVTLSMSVSVPGMEVATRALGEYGYTDGAHPSLWVVVFDQQGYLVETAKAYDQKYTEDSEDHTTTTQFSVDLHATPEPCTIHYLLNYSDDDNLELSYGHETSVIGALAVENKDVYWQRKSLPGGINDKVDYVATNFTQIPLVRNFAKITVTNSANNFMLSGFYVLNVPKTGTVAPLTNGAFVNYQPTVPTGQTLYGVLTSGGYLGNMPDGVEFSNTAAPAADAFKKDAVYLYENTYSQNAKLVPTILIKGRFGTDTNDTYYKADLLTNNLETGLQDYAHILRNFHYILNIKSVVASGKSDPQGAMNAAANNNLSGAVEIKDLTSVTNGQAGIYVSFTDTTLVSSNPIVLKYKFVPDITKPAEVNNARVTVVAPAGDVLASEAVKGNNDINTGSWTGWRTLTISPKELPSSTKEQTIVLYDQTTLLRREVIIRLRPKLTMEVQCDPKVVDAEAGESMTLNLMFDSNLNPALFPLDFTIESQTNASSSTLKQYISPAKTEVISVQTGTSIVPGYAGSKSYQYVKTLSYDDYKQLSTNADGQVIFPVAFVTNIAANASTVYVRNQYFNDADDFFLNEAAALVDGGFYGARNEVQLVFTATTAGTYTVTSDDLVATRAVSEQKELAAGEVCEMTLYTSDWSDPVSVAITGPSSYSWSKTGVTRNKLAMKATSIKTSINNVETELGYQTFGVYNSETAAKAMTGSIGTAVSADMKTATGSILVHDGLAEGTTLWFAYEDTESIYVASATAGALHAGAELNFVGSYKPLDMQVEFGTGADRYGDGQAFTLTFTTNRTGKYVVTSVNFNGVTANGEFDATAGVPIIVPCSHSSWNTQASITVQFTGNEAGGTNPETFTGPVRNKLVLGKMSAGSNAPSNNTSVTIYNASNNRALGTATWSQLKAGEVEVTINNLADMNTAAVYFQYTTGNWYNSQTYTTGTLNGNQAVSGSTLNFTRN